MHVPVKFQNPCPTVIDRAGESVLALWLGLGAMVRVRRRQRIYPQKGLKWGLTLTYLHDLDLIKCR